MSRGFVKEDDQEEAPFIPPRAALPAGVTNYVTPLGLKLLQQEKKSLEEERAEVDAMNEVESRRLKSVIDGKIKLLNERLTTARVLDPASQTPDQVRFGAKVKIKDNTGKVQEFQIVGVDEADVKKQKIAFIAPIARAVTGKKVGEIADFKMGDETRNLQILEITY